MLHNATEFYESWPATMNTAKERGPDIGRAFGAFFQGLMKDGGEGGLSVKHKELIALGIGVAVRCEPCIYAHVEKCLKAGATRVERRRRKQRPRTAPEGFPPQPCPEKPRPDRAGLRCH